MKLWYRLPRTFRLTVAIVTVEMLFFTLMRAVFWRLFHDPIAPAAQALTVHAFYLGLKFDLRLALSTCVPFLLLAWWRPVSPFARVGARRLWCGYFTVLALFLVLAYLVDLGHYGYLETRLNATVLQYLENPLISLRMMWETYPMIPGLLALALIGVGAWFGVRALLASRAIASASALAGWRRFVAGVLVTVVVLGGLYGKFSWYPLRWSEAFFSSNSFVSELALNPVLQFVDTFKNRAAGYDLDRTRDAYDTVASFLAVPRPDRTTLNYTRNERPAGVISSRPNIVVIFLESFAAYKVGAFGNPLRPTPNFDAIARDGILFTRCYTPAFGTARSVFAATTGIPDIESQETSSRNPLVVRQRTIVNAWNGFEKLYFLGGSANWGNIRGLLTHNLPNLRLFEEGSYTSPRVDVWGISDLHLFEEANRVLRGLGDKPFFAVIQTSGHHRPYTIPADNRGFERVHVGEKELRPYGFSELDELNSFRFLDHSLGYFFRIAREEKYFANTVFVMFGDHGLPGTAQHLPPSEVDLFLTHFHVPLLIYAPVLLPKGRAIDTVASEVDVLPTVASLTGTPYINTTFGRDLLDPRFADTRYAFILPDKFGLTDQFGRAGISLVSDRFYLSMPQDGIGYTLHDLLSRKPVTDVQAAHPEQARTMATLCRAVYETARYMLYHNQPLAVEGPPPAAAGAR